MTKWVSHALEILVLLMDNRIANAESNFIFKHENQNDLIKGLFCITLQFAQSRFTIISYNELDLLFLISVT